MEEEPAAESNPSRNCSIPAPLLGCKGLTGANNKLPSFSLQKQLNKVAFLDSQAALKKPSTANTRMKRLGKGKSFLS